MERWFAGVAGAALATVTLLAPLVAGCGSSAPVARKKVPATTAAPPSSALEDPTCVSLPVDDVVRSALVTADARPGAADVPGATFYGRCGSTMYAVASFEAGPAATAAQATAFQSHGGYPEFFTSTGSEGWKLTGSAPGPPGVADCSAFSALPPQLRTLWDDCVVHTPPIPTTVAGTTTTLPPPSTAPSTCVQFATQTFARITSVVVHSDGSATLSGVPQKVICGGANDYHYEDGGAPQTYTLVAGAQIGIFDIPSMAEKPLAVQKLGAYLAHPELGVFQIYGTPDDVTEITEQYHP